MNILSLFGGVETGLIALKELGVKIDNYYSSEVNKYASAVARFNHPEIVELGDISNYKKWELPRIDLILAGPPCQGFSVAGKGLNWEDPRSQLFFTAIEILWEYKPKYFLFENVASMKKEIRAEIDELMGVDHMMINSALVSAQNRKRNYWFNWDVGQPKDKGILLKDIIQSGESARQIIFVCDLAKTLADIKKINPRVRAISLNENGIRPHRNDKSKSGISELGRFYFINAKKSYTLIASHVPNLITGIENFAFRKLTTIECERLQTLPDNYTQNGTNEKAELIKISDTQRYKAIGNGWTKDVVKHILQGIL